MSSGDVSPSSGAADAPARIWPWGGEGSVTGVAVMGILNVTPDSFSDGGAFVRPAAAIDRAATMVDEGAAIIDVGGESTRPGAASVSVQAELDRVVPVIEALHGRLPAVLSIDTSKPEVMEAAVRAGASMINDVRALRGEGALEVAASLGVPVCVMHMQGEPRSMQANPVYGDVVREVRNFLLERARACQAAGIPAADILIDPGFGFGKTLAHNLALLASLERFVEVGHPVLVGLSRKSMIGAVTDKPVDDRVFGSVAGAVIAAMKGAAVLRVHDVGATVDAVRLVRAVREA